MVYLEDINVKWTSEYKILDSTRVLDGKFTFEGSIDSPTILRVHIPRTIEEDNQALLYMYEAELLSENADITLNLSRPSNPYAQYSTSIVSSNGLNGEFGEMQKQIMEIENKIFEAITRKQIENTPLTMKDLNIMEAQDSLRLVVLQNILSLNKDNILGVYCLSMLMYEMDDISLVQIDSLINEVPLAQSFIPIMEQYNSIKSAELTSVGSKFIDFPAKSADGTTAKISDYVGRGKLVLLHFGASWCGSCIDGLPQLRQNYEDTPELSVIGIHLSGSEENFHKYIKNYDIPWRMLYAGEDKTILDLYGLSGIPTYILINQEGIISYKGLVLPSIKSTGK